MGHVLFYTEVIKEARKRITSRKRSVFFMKGYFTAEGFMGLVEGRYILFADEADYLDYCGNN